MDAVCMSSDRLCHLHALAAALHSLNLYCTVISTALICCCSKPRPRRSGSRWRYQNVRGVASLALGVTWCCGGAAASMRPADTVGLVAALMPPLAWLSAAALHVSLWTRRSSAPILYLAIYWLLSAASSASVLYQLVQKDVTSEHIELYIHGAALLLTLIIGVVDCICFYDEVIKRYNCRQKSSPEPNNVIYNYKETHFYSKITFFWLNLFLCKGYFLPEDTNDIGDIPENECSKIHYNRFKECYKREKVSPDKITGFHIWKCYARMVWPNFYIAGFLKLFGDFIGIVPAIGIAIIIQFIESTNTSYNYNTPVTIDEFISNGFVMLLIISLALIVQALLSQNSTHLVTVEGTRLKMALQSVVYDKCMKLASWSVDPDVEEETPLLHNPEEEANTQSGLLMNLVSQDTYNIMSCVWICHYIWSIPLKVSVILYLLYVRVGLSAIIGIATSLLIVTPLQFYIGKKISDNSRHISKCTDHRVSKISEILQGINVIKLYVWEDLFNEKILQLREVELKLLNRDSAYWGFLTFTTQVSTVLVTVVTFTTHYFIEDSSTLTATKVFAGLALFNQLTVPLLILPVTILMIIQAMVSTNRIKDFLELPEAFNVPDENIDDDSGLIDSERTMTDDFLDNPLSERGELENDVVDTNKENKEVFQSEDILISFNSSAFSWRMKDNAWLEIDDLDIPAGKLIMVVGSSGSGKSSLLSAILGEMHHERGDVKINEKCSMWYSGQPPWLLEGSIRDNILMGSTWCATRYNRVMRATGMRPDLQLLPDGDNTQLGICGAPLSGGQRVRLSIARALYSRARLIVLDEPLGALDVPLARHLVARALLPAARAGRTVILATNRLELLHYADLIIVMEDGRVRDCGRVNSTCNGAIRQWALLAAEARESASRGSQGPSGGAARERSHLMRAVSRTQFQLQISDESLPQIGINEVAGAHLLTEVPTCAGGSWRNTISRIRSPLSRQLSTPSPDMPRTKWLREIRRAVSVDASNEALQQEASLLRRILPTRPYRTLYNRWTPWTLRRFISSDSDKGAQHNNQNCNNGPVEVPDSTFVSLTSNGIETSVTVPDVPLTNKEQPVLNENTICWTYCRSCGWWGAVYLTVAILTQGLALTADWWLTQLTDSNSRNPLSDQQVWDMIRIYAVWCAGGVCTAAFAQVACACAGARSRRKLHERLLHATLHAPLYYHHTHPAGDTLHRFSSDTLVIDKKLSTAVSRWAQIALLCVGAVFINVFISAWTLLALIPAFMLYVALQSVYLRNARELQHIEATSAGRAVSLAVQTSTGAGAVRAGRLQPRMREAFYTRLDRNHNALLLLNSANRWLSLSLDLVGAASVFISLAVALYTNSNGALTGLAGTYSLLLPVYLAHLAKCRADLDLQLASVQRLINNTDIPQEDYRDDCPIPAGWQRNGKIEFEDVSIQHQSDTPPVLRNINLTIKPGQKLAICGRSGSGKSTLLLTCVGATKICSGRVLLDGQDITKVPLRALRHRVIVLPQEAILFSGTLRENLDPLAMHTDEEIWDSLKAVGLYDYVSAQPAGLECGVCGWRGVWGGGRGARVCGARAALHARLAAALLLDEPGAALEAAAERSLLHAIAAVAPNTTVLTVAHRVSSVRDYDSATVLQGGSLYERGRVDDLLAAPSSALTRLHAAQHTLIQLY